MTFGKRWSSGILWLTVLCLALHDGTPISTPHTLDTLALPSPSLSALTNSHRGELTVVFDAGVGQETKSGATDGPAVPGKAGYALVFHDNIILKEDFKVRHITAAAFLTIDPCRTFQRQR